MPFSVRRGTSGSRLATRHSLLAVLLLALLLPTAHSQTARNADLDRLRGEIGRLKLRLEEMRQKTRTAEEEAEEAQLELDIRTGELEIAVDLQQRLEEEKHAIEAQIAALGPRIERQKTYLTKRLVALYQMGGLSYVRMFLAIDQRRDPIEAMSMLSYLVSSDARAIARFQAARAQLGKRYFDLADRTRRVAQMRQVVEQRRRDVLMAVGEKERRLAKLRVEESGSQRQLAELEEKARRLERLLTVLANQKGGVAPAIDIRSVQGALEWPVKGKVTESFGRQRNPKFATYTTNNGLKISAAAGSPVRAVFQGTVLFSQWFKGYGNLIILDHGNRVFSLYGNLKAPSIAVGDRIATGQTIAGVGESEDASAGHLYFEIRRDNRPEDPQTWLR